MRLPAANGSRSEHEPWTVAALAELLRETAEHYDYYEKTRRVSQKISCISSHGMQTCCDVAGSKKR
jgi:hypothetical protein